MRGKNLFLIVVDNWRWDIVEKRVTPFVLKFFKHRTRGCYTTATWTLPAHASLFTSLLPSQHKRNVPYHGSISHPTFPEIIKHDDYTSYLLCRDEWFKQEYGLQKGFDYVDWRPKSETDPLSDFRLKAREPWFICLHTFILHNYLREEDCPVDDIRWTFVDQRIKDAVYHSKEQIFDTVAKLTENFTSSANLQKRDFALLRGLYCGHMYFVDKLLSDLLPRFNLSKTDILLTSDHGEALGDVWRSKRQFHHRVGCYGEFMTRVPMFATFKLPEGSFSLKDILPWWYLDVPPERDRIFCECFNYKDKDFNLVRVLNKTYRVNNKQDFEFYWRLGNGYKG